MTAHVTVTHYEKGMAFKNLRSNLGTKLKPPPPQTLKCTTMTMITIEIRK